MAKTPLFRGSCTAIITPFTKTGVDYEQLERNIEFQYENGTAAVVACGTTGENATLTGGEHNEVIRRVIHTAKGRMKVIAGVGGNNTERVLRLAEDAKFMGADGILMICPYYNKTTQKGLIEHFTYVADRVDLPMILYNVPSRTGMSIAPETYKALSEHPNINGVKEASGDIALVGTIRSLCGDALNIWSGNDSDTVPMMALGAHGVISVASNIVPAAVTKLCALCLDGNYPEATALYAKYAAFFSALFIETNPIPVKTAMRLAGMDSGIMRLPLTEMYESNLEKLKAAMHGIGIET